MISFHPLTRPLPDTTPSSGLVNQLNSAHPLSLNFNLSVSLSLSLFLSILLHCRSNIHTVVPSLLDILSLCARPSARPFVYSLVSSRSQSARYRIMLRSQRWIVHLICDCNLVRSIPGIGTTWPSNLWHARPLEKWEKPPANWNHAGARVSVMSLLLFFSF